MKKSYTMWLVATVLGTIFQISFIDGAPYLQNINLVIIMLTFISSRSRFPYLTFCIISGYILDIYSYNAFGINILSLSLIGLTTNYFIANFLSTHRITPIILLLGVNIIFYNTITWFFLFVLRTLKIGSSGEYFSLNLLKGIGAEIIATLSAVSIVYTIYYFFGQKISFNFLKISKKI